MNLEDSGLCSVTAKDQASGTEAINFIRSIIKEDEIGDVLDGKVVKILDGVGAIVEYAKGKSGMIHISKLAVKERVEKIETVVNVGDTVRVKIINIDKEKGRIGLERMV